MAGVVDVAPLAGSTWDERYMAIKAWKLNRPIHPFVPDAREAAGDIRDGSFIDRFERPDLVWVDHPGQPRFRLARWSKTDITTNTPTTSTASPWSTRRSKRSSVHPDPADERFWVRRASGDPYRPMGPDRAGRLPQAGVHGPTARWGLPTTGGTTRCRSAPRCSTAASSSTRADRVRPVVGSGRLLTFTGPDAEADSLRAVAEAKAAKAAKPRLVETRWRTWNRGRSSTATTVTCGKWSTGPSRSPDGRGFWRFRRRNLKTGKVGEVECDVHAAGGDRPDRHPDPVHPAGPRRYRGARPRRWGSGSGRCDMAYDKLGFGTIRGTVSSPNPDFLRRRRSPSRRCARVIGAMTRDRVKDRHRDRVILAPTCSPTTTCMRATWSTPGSWTTTGRK